MELHPDHPATLNNMGTSLQALGHNEEAIEVYERARDLAPDQPATLINLGTAEMDRNRIVVAMDCFTRAIILAGSEQEIALARKNLGLSMMLSGNLENGSAHYAARWQTREFTPRGCAAPQWDGAPFPDRTLFIHGEQGFGDAIQMVRFAALAKARGGRVVVEARPSLAPLLATADGVDAVASGDGPPPDFDLYLPMFDLLATLKVTLSTIPATVPYVAVNSARRERWADRIPETGRRRIGLVWAGHPTHRNDRNRSIPLATMRPLLETMGNDFYSLQVGPRTADIAASGWRDYVIDLAAYLTDFAETAAALERIDLLIAADTAVVHLAGALGRPVWTLLPFAPDWRWLLDREDSPWYPTMRLFRQTTPRDWPEVVGRVRAALAGNSGTV